MKKKQYNKRVPLIIPILILTAVFVAAYARKWKSLESGAPQLAIDNPGDQSEFTPSPSGEPGLG